MQTDTKAESQEERTDLMEEGHDLTSHQFDNPYDEARAKKKARFRNYGIGLGLIAMLLLLIVVIQTSNKDSSQERSEGPITTSSTFESGEDMPNENEGNHKEDGPEPVEMVWEDFFPEEQEMNCTQEEINKYHKTSHAYKVKLADCGAKYEFIPQAKPSPVKVVLYGEKIRKNLLLSGCHVGAKCTEYPDCHFTVVVHGNSLELKIADVLVAAPEDLVHMSALKKESKKPKVRKVLYWREPWWDGVVVDVQQKHSDVQMGVYFTSAITNPTFFRRPHTLLTSFNLNTAPIPFEEKLFAISIISVCHSRSARENYIAHLLDYLGQDRIHRYGRCGNRRLPPPPMVRAAKVIAQYKFYLAFENTIMNSYVTEKLFTILNMDILPVYMGAPNMMNVTVIPSFVNVMDFKNPKDLALHLLYLDGNKEAYDEYHKWRTSSSYFSEEYLDHVARKVAGQAEVHANNKNSRAAACCRLCNLNFLDERIATRKDSDLIPRFWTKDEINRRLFKGQLLRRPGKLLKPYVKPKRNHDVPPPDQSEESPVVGNENGI